MDREQHDRPLPPMLTERALAVRWQVSPRTLQRWRCCGTGPPFLMLGGGIRYRLADILSHEEQNRSGAEDGS